MTKADPSGSSLFRGTTPDGSGDRVRIVVFAAAVAVGGYLVGNLFAAALLGVTNAVIEASGQSVLNQQSRAVLISTIGIQGLGFGGTAYYVLRRVDFEPGFVRVERPHGRSIALGIGGFVLLLGLFLGIERLYSALNVQTAGSSIVSSALGNPVLGVVLIVLSIVLVGPAEELLYRGIVQTTFKRAIGAPLAIVATGVVFASIHLFGLNGTFEMKLATVSIVFVLALVLGALYELTDDLVVPALAHGLYNATTFAIVVFGSATG